MTAVTKLTFLNAPFPYFGGKSKVAHIVWQCLGDVKHYIEPFFGSGAVLLRRPDYRPEWHIETVNDANGYVANVWRSLQYAPDEVARWCDWPVNHADLIARKRKLMQGEQYLLENLTRDERWYDPVIAGYWIWCASCSIGGNFSLGQIPHITTGGQGVHKMRGRTTEYATNRAVIDGYNDHIYSWFRQLSERLRYVRVVCGDWKRVCGGRWQARGGTVGLFFDPPYSGVTGRDTRKLYGEDSLSVAHEVREWVKERGREKGYRIVVAGYEEEHRELLDYGWRVYRWETNGGYGNQRKVRGKNTNKYKETLFISPHCLDTNQ